MLFTNTIEKIRLVVVLDKDRDINIANIGRSRHGFLKLAGQTRVSVDVQSLVNHPTQRGHQDRRHNAGAATISKLSTRRVTPFNNHPDISYVAQRSRRSKEAGRVPSPLLHTQLGALGRG